MQVRVRVARQVFQFSRDYVNSMITRVQETVCSTQVVTVTYMKWKVEVVLKIEWVEQKQDKSLI